MFSSPSPRRSSRFGGGETDAVKHTTTHYRVPIQPSAAFQVRRDTLCDYDLYLVPASQLCDTQDPARLPTNLPPLMASGSGHSISPLARSFLHTADGQQTKMTTVDLSINIDKQKIKQGNKTLSGSLNDVSLDIGCTSDKVCTSFIDHNTALQGRASSDDTSDASSASLKDSSDHDSPSELDDEASLSSSGSDRESDGTQAGDAGFISRVRRSRRGLRLPVTFTSDNDSFPISPSDDAVVENNRNAQDDSLDDIPRDLRFRKHDANKRNPINTQAPLKQPSPRLHPGTASERADKATPVSFEDPSSMHRSSNNFQITATPGIDSQIWNSWNINSWNATRNGGGYSLSMPRPYLPLQFTASQLRRVVENHSKPSPQPMKCADRANPLVDTFSTWDAFHTECQKLYKDLNLPPPLDDGLSSQTTAQVNNGKQIE